MPTKFQVVATLSPFLILVRAHVFNEMLFLLGKPGAVFQVEVRRVTDKISTENLRAA